MATDGGRAARDPSVWRKASRRSGCANAHASALGSERNAAHTSSGSAARSAFVSSQLQPAGACAGARRRLMEPPHCRAPAALDAPRSRRAMQAASPVYVPRCARTQRDRAARAARRRRRERHRGQIAHGDGKEHPAYGEIVQGVAADGGDHVVVEGSVSHEHGIKFERSYGEGVVQHVQGIAPCPVRLRRQRVPDLPCDGGEEGAGGLPCDRRRLVAHAACERDSRADVVAVGGRQDGSLHVCMEIIPWRYCDNLVGMVQRRTQKTHDRRPCRIHTGCDCQTRQRSEIIPFGALDEHRKDPGMTITGDG